MPRLSLLIGVFNCKCSISQISTVSHNSKNSSIPPFSLRPMQKTTSHYFLFCFSQTFSTNMFSIIVLRLAGVSFLSLNQSSPSMMLNIVQPKSGIGETFSVFPPNWNGFISSDDWTLCMYHIFSYEIFHEQRMNVLKMKWYELSYHFYKLL